MAFSLNPKSVSLLFLALHATIFSVILLLHWFRDSRRSSLLLSILLLLSSLYIFPFLAGYAGWYGINTTRHLLFYFPFQQLFLIAPILYFYFKNLLDEGFAFNVKEIFHFIPGVLYILYSIIMFINDQWLNTSLKFYGDGRDRDFDAWYQVVGFISLCIYASVSLRLYFNYVSRINNTVSYADEVMFRWARNFLLAFLLLLALRFAFFITNPEWGQFGQKFWYYVCFGAVTFFLTINGFAHAIARDVTLTRPAPQPNTDDTPESRSIDDPKIKELSSKVIDALDLKELYKNPRLTVSDLADEVGIQEKRMSQTINQAFGMNFNDLINLYRIGNILSRIDRGDLKYRTILGLAQDSGFNSKTTFNRVFKKVVGVNPKDYLLESAKSGAKSGFGATRRVELPTFTEKR